MWSNNGNRAKHFLWFRRLPVRKWLTVLLTLLIHGMIFSCALAGESRTTSLHPSGFTLSSQAIGQNFRAALPLFPPGRIPRGWAGDAGVTWTNIWAQEKCYHMDYETARFQAGLSRGITSTWGVAVVYDRRTFFGGAMDSLIQEGHDLMGINQNHRDEYPKNRSVIELFDPITGDSIDRFSPDQLNNSGASIIISANLGGVGDFFTGINLYGVARFPLESPEILDQQGGVETGFGLGLTKRLGKGVSMSGVLGYTGLKEARYSGRALDRVSFENHQITAMASLAWHIRQGFSLEGQYIYTSPVLKGIRGMDKASHEVILGAAMAVTQHHTLNFGVIENIINMDNSPDFGIHLSLKQHF